jgi:hypothetical protein
MMEKKSKETSRADLSHLGPPGIARQLGGAGGQKLYVDFGGREARAPVAARARIAELEGEVANLKRLLGARDEALAAALELAAGRQKIPVDKKSVDGKSSVDKKSPRGRPRVAGERPWETKGISRAAWYKRRRQEERRADEYAAEHGLVRPLK